MQLTTRNHYNPCFWTANWNPEYFKLALKSKKNEGKARNQRVFALNIKSNKVYQVAVENLHYDKNLGIAEITPDAALGFCKWHFPNEYEQFREEMKDHPETLVLDFENVLTCLEESLAYKTLLKVITRPGLRSGPEKGALAAFLAVHHLRSHAIMNSMIEFGEQTETPKFEYFWMLKRWLGNVNVLFPWVMTLTAGRWVFYRMDKDTFPLNDSPILIRPDSVMVALSPRLLLEIERNDHSLENGWRDSNSITNDKLAEFRRRTIGNTFREIIFGDAALLEVWRTAPEFSERHQLMANTNSYNAVVAKHLDGELWKINAHGNMS